MKTSKRKLDVFDAPFEKVGEEDKEDLSEMILVETSQEREAIRYCESQYPKQYVIQFVCAPSLKQWPEKSCFSLVVKLFEVSVPWMTWECYLQS